MQPTRLDPVVDCVVAHPEASHLRSCNDSVLSLREPRDRPIHPFNSTFAAYDAVNLIYFGGGGHAAPSFVPELTRVTTSA